MTFPSCPTISSTVIAVCDVRLEGIRLPVLQVSGILLQLFTAEKSLRLFCAISVTAGTVAQHNKKFSCSLAVTAGCRRTLNKEMLQILVTMRSMLGYEILFNKFERDADEL